MEIFDRNSIDKILPMRYPYMILDELRLEEGVHAESVIRLKKDEWFFECHFPGNPILPGLLLLEAMGQTLLSTFIRQTGLKDSSVPLMTGISDIKFEGYCVPNDTVYIDAELLKYKYGIAKGVVRAYKNDKTTSSLLAEINVSYALPSALEKMYKVNFDK